MSASAMLIRVLVCLGLVGAAAVHHFGWLEGLGIVAGVWLLMPYGEALRP